MDIKKVVSFDKDVIWKSEHTSNPYAMVLNAKKIWRFTKTENTEKFGFFKRMIDDNSVLFKRMIDDNSVLFKWGLHKQKSFKVFYHQEYVYFYTQDDIVYKALLKKEEKKKKVKKLYKKL